MLFRSTGLGKTELKGVVDTMQRQGDYLIMYVDVTDPVKWRTRVAMGFRDLAEVMGCMAREPSWDSRCHPNSGVKRNPSS